MQKRKLGSSSMYVSEVALGCMSLGTNVEHASSIIDKALDSGINFLDTADLYDFGVNEEIVGKAVKGKRDQVIIGTKVGNRWTDDKSSWTWDPSKRYIKEQVKHSLQRLQLDYIDLYQLHGGTVDDPIEDTIEAFEELIQEGLIRYYGISSIRPNVIREYVKRSNIVSVMMQYNIFDRRPEEQMLELLRDNNISVIARGPLAKGLLTDKWQHKINSNGYMTYSEQELRSILPQIADITGHENRADVAIQYCLHHPAVATVIPGASKIEQVLTNAQAGSARPLSDEEMTAIQALLKPILYEDHR